MIQTKSKFMSLFLAFILILSVNLFSKENFKVQAANNGSTGLLEIPDARIMDEYSMRIFYNTSLPYKYYGIALTPLPFLETNLHFTQLSGINGFSNSDAYGDYKDKSISFKLQLLKESNYLPSIVVGGEDIWGTSLYSSKYIALSKKISYFDFTLGYAKGRLGGEDLRKYSATTSNSGSSNNNAVNFLLDTQIKGGDIFAGVKMQATPKLSLVLEYSGIEYTKDKQNPFKSGSSYELPSSKINVGIKYKITNRLDGTLSYQRGNKISFGLNYQFGFNRTGLYDHPEDNKWKASNKKKEEYKTYDTKTLSDKLANEVAAEKFSNVVVSTNENKIWLEIDNDRYANDLQAASRAFGTISEVAPQKFDTFYLTIKNKGVPTKTLKVNRKEFDLYNKDDLSSSYMKKALSVTNQTTKSKKEFKNKKSLYTSDIISTNKFKYSIAPKLQTHLNVKDKPFATKLDLKLDFTYDIMQGLYLKGDVRYPLYNGFKDLKTLALESNKLSIRTQLIDYRKYNKTQLKNLTLNYVKHTPFNTISKVELGYFEYAYAGIDLETFKPLFNDRAGIGIQYQYVYKRYVGNMLKVYNDLQYSSKFVNLYYLMSPKYDLHLNMKIGQFLAGDKGVRVDFIRSYKNFTLGAFATFTNSKDIFTSNENKGYIDKGIYMKIPLEVFSKKNSKIKANYGFKPWTRDVGQFVDTGSSLSQMLNNENNSQIMKKNIHYLKE